ncbi:hypothetical protein B0H13DRAFT_2334716 [Mycena leptocephala]|nr:hypothetical protein B0H13DRAFT_2334716 [Mycena leptocephala]
MNTSNSIYPALCSWPAASTSYDVALPLNATSAQVAMQLSLPYPTSHQFQIHRTLDTFSIPLKLDAGKVHTLYYVFSCLVLFLGVVGCKAWVLAPEPNPDVDPKETIHAVHAIIYTLKLNTLFAPSLSFTPLTSLQRPPKPNITSAGMAAPQSWLATFPFTLAVLWYAGCPSSSEFNLPAGQ